jgi:hypothetical protein
MAFRAPVKTEQQSATAGTGAFATLLNRLDDPTAGLGFATPLAAGATIARGAVPALKWLTDRVVGGGSMLSGPVSKITQVPVKDIIVRASDHPDAINPLKVQEIQGLLSKTPSRLPAVELVRQGNQYILKDGRHRFTAAQGLGLENVPAIIAK